MKTTFIGRRANARNNAPLVLMFAGWGMDETPFADYSAPEGCDLALCFDYTTLDFENDFFAGREVRRVVAWSLGVWAASVAFGRVPALANAPQRIAANGTPFPIDDERGIPKASFDGTLTGLSDIALAKFIRRMCRDDATLAFFNARRPERPLESLRAELAAIREAVAAEDVDGARFTHAIVGKRDAIFTPRNQLAAWESSDKTDGNKTTIITTDSPHYDDAVLRNAIYGH